MEKSRIELEAFRMRNGRSTTELHPHCKRYITYLIFYFWWPNEWQCFSNFYFSTYKFNSILINTVFILHLNVIILIRYNIFFNFYYFLYIFFINYYTCNNISALSCRCVKRVIICVKRRTLLIHVFLKRVHFICV